MSIYDLQHKPKTNLITLTGKIQSLDQSRDPIVTYILMSDVTVKDLNQEILLSNSRKLGFLESLDCEVLTSKVASLELGHLATTQEETTLIAKVSTRTFGNRVEIRRDNGAEMVTKRVIRYMEVLQSKVEEDDEDGLFELKSQINKDLKFLSNKAHLGEFVPHDLTLSQIQFLTKQLDQQFTDILPNIQSTSRQSQQGLMTTQETIDALEASHSSREGLKKAFINHLKETGGDEPLFVVVNGRTTEVSNSDNDESVRVTLEDVEILPYDRNSELDEATVIDHIDHINSYLSTEFFAKNKGYYKVKKRKRHHLARVILYRRNSDRANETGRSSLEVGIQLIKFAPVQMFLDRLTKVVSNWDESKNHSQLNQCIEFFTRKDTFILPDTKEITLPQALEQFEFLKSQVV